MDTINLGNNETISRGIMKQPDGSFLALTFSKSKYFSTKRGAEKWLQRNTK